MYNTSITIILILDDQGAVGNFCSFDLFIEILIEYTWFAKSYLNKQKNIYVPVAYTMPIKLKGY